MWPQTVSVLRWALYLIGEKSKRNRTSTSSGRSTTNIRLVARLKVSRGSRAPASVLLVDSIMRCVTSPIST